MKAERPPAVRSGPAAAPLTLEGTSVLHQMFRLRRAALRELGSERREAIARATGAALAEVQRREDGESAAFSILGHKGDLMLVHFRTGFDHLARAEAAVAALPIDNYLEPTTSYLSMVEIGLYEASVRIYQRLAADGVEAGTPQWRDAIDA